MTSSELHKQVDKWRSRALKHIRSMQPGKERDSMARKYYQADQSGMNILDAKKGWPEMEAYLVEQTQDELKQQRDDLIKVRSVCGEHIAYKEAWRPTLEEFREIHPFDPADDLRKRSKNKDKAHEQTKEQSSNEKRTARRSPTQNTRSKEYKHHGQKDVADSPEDVSETGLPKPGDDITGDRWRSVYLRNPRWDEWQRQRKKIRQDLASIKGKQGKKRRRLQKKLARIDRQEQAWRDAGDKQLERAKQKSRIWRSVYEREKES